MSANERSLPIARAALPHRSAWHAAGLAFAWLMLGVHAAAGFHSAGVPDFWRDVYWATKIAHGEAFPLAGPPIYGLVELGPWWFYLLALPIGVSGSVAFASSCIQVLAGLKYFLAWRLGTRWVDERFGLALAGSFAIAGWSAIPLLFPSHTALVETTLLLLALVTWRCWRHFSLGNAALFGLAAGACLHAHPTTVSYVAIAGIVLLVRDPSLRGVGRLALAASIVLVLLAPPWFETATAVRDRSIDAYMSKDVAVDFLRRVPLLIESLVAGGAWTGFLLMTTWSAAHARLAWAVYCACLVIAAAGFVMLPRDAARLRLAAMIAAAIFVLQASFLVLLRPITPMWMLSSALPPLAVILAIGWYGWLGAGRGALRIAGAVALAVFVALSVAPFGLFFRELRSLRVAEGANPLQNAIESGDRYKATSVPFYPVRLLDRIAPDLCGEAVLHGRLAWVIEQSLGTTVRLACGHWPTLRYGGREGPSTHIAGLFERAADASGVAPDRIVADMALYEHVVPIAPASGGRPSGLRRDQIHVDGAPRASAPLALDFDARGGDVAVLTNRFPLAAPMGVHSVVADGRPAKQLYDDGGSILFGCAACDPSSTVHWHFALDAVEDNLDLAVIQGSARGDTVPR